MMKLDPNEVQFVKAAVEAVTIHGKDARFVVGVLDKLDKEWAKVQPPTKEKKLK